jgi:diamine N-acetyltransferase
MTSEQSLGSGGTVMLQAVRRENWRSVAQLKVAPEQASYVAEPAYYLALCCYDGLWHPLAIVVDEQVIGFMMWAVDPKDSSCWLGGLLIDQRYQGQGYGRQAVQAALAMLKQQYGYQNFALSYQPSNLLARHLYQSLGFVESDEWEDDEIVARISVTP